MSILLQRGSVGSEVVELQKNLNQILGIHLTVDGTFGPATRAAVKAFQQISHVSVDGIVGEQTMNCLKIALKQPR